MACVFCSALDGIALVRGRVRGEWLWSLFAGDTIRSLIAIARETSHRYILLCNLQYSPLAQPASIKPIRRITNAKKAQCRFIAHKISSSYEPTLLTHHSTHQTCNGRTSETYLLTLPSLFSRRRGNISCISIPSSGLRIEDPSGLSSPATLAQALKAAMEAEEVEYERVVLLVIELCSSGGADGKVYSGFTCLQLSSSGP